ncbi:hypothetical protein ACIQXQ_20075 [Peribacillus sp. NPDC097198]
MKANNELTLKYLNTLVEIKRQGIDVEKDILKVVKTLQKDIK